MKKFILVAPLLLLLGACTVDSTTTKTTGTVQSVNRGSSGWGDCGTMYITYKIPGGKYGVDEYSCDTHSQCGEFHAGDKLTVYYNNGGVREVSK